MPPFLVREQKTRIGAPFWDTILSTKYWDAETKTLAYQLRDYVPGISRWMSRDPIGEGDGPNLFTFVRNASSHGVDYLGLLKVCCRDVRGEVWWERMWRHCHITDSCGSGEEAFDVWSDDSCDRKMDNGKQCCCATKADIQKCIQRHPYSDAPRGSHDHWWEYIDNN